MRAAGPASYHEDRTTRLITLAITFDELIRTGQVESYSKLTRMEQVTPARVSQIMNLLVQEIQGDRCFCRESSERRSSRM